MDNEKRVPTYSPSSFGLRMRENTESSSLIFGCVLARVGSGVNKVTDALRADINSELTHKKRDISVKLTLWSSSGIFTPDAHTVMSST